MLAEDGVGAPGVALRARGRGDAEESWAPSTPAEGGRGGGEVISKGRGLLTLENCSEVLAATRINQCVRRGVQRPSPLSALAIQKGRAHTHALERPQVRTIASYKKWNY